MEYIVFIHKNADTAPTRAEWDRFIAAALQSGLFQGGSEIGSRHTIGAKTVPDTSTSVGGFMRFDSEDPSPLFTLLQNHPVVQHGGTIEVFAMPKS